MSSSETAAGKLSTRPTRQEFSFVAELSAISISRMFGLFMVLPVVALWSRSLNGATPLLVGIAVGGYGVTQALLQVPFGALSDRIGRGPVVVLGLSLFLIGSVIVASADSIHGVIAGRFLQGAGAVSATLSAWLADLTREQVRTISMALFGAGIGVSFLLALVLGPLLANLLRVRGLFWASAACGALGIALTLHAWWRQPKQRVIAEKPRTDWRRVLRRELLTLDLAVLGLHAALTGFFVVAPFLLIDRLRFPDSQHWVFYAGTLAASLLIAVPMIALAGRRADRNFNLLAVALMLIGLVSMIWASTLAWFAVGCTLFFAGFSYLEASLPALLSIRADAGQRGASMGVFSSAQFFGAFVGATVCGWMVGVADAAYGMGALAVIIGVWLLFEAGKLVRPAP
ncbi:MAG: MFS transporter [Pseudomonadota bacterium]